MVKKLVVLFFILSATVAFADDITLTTPEPLVPMTAPKLKAVVDLIDVKAEIITVKWGYLNSNGQMIVSSNTDRNGWRYWNCENAASDDPATSYNDTTCFDSIWRFEVRQADVGQQIGAGLRTLIWNKLKTVAVPGNDGTFDDAQ